MFFTFRQNNSFGTFDFDAERGISVNVIIEANAVEFAIRRAEKIGLYFDGEGDCNCCGNRWSHPWEEGSEQPQVYGEIVRPGARYAGRFNKWMDEGQPEGFIHYSDGKIKGFWTSTAKTKKKEA